MRAICAELRETANDLFGVIASGDVKVAVNQRFKLADVRAAHEALHSRATTGATVLLPYEPFAPPIALSSGRAEITGQSTDVAE